MNSKTTLIIVGIIILVFVAIVWKGMSGPSTDTQGTPLEVTAQDQILGNSAAPVTLVEYGDFQCPACRSYHFLLEQVKEEFPDELRIVYRHFPLQQIHPQAFEAALVAEAAGLQGKFWEMHDMLFENQPDWSGSGNAQDMFVSYGQEIGLDTEQLLSDMERGDVKEKVQMDIRTARALRVNSTPTFFLQGEMIQNPRSPEEFISLIQAEIVKANIADAEEQKTHIHAGFAMYVQGQMMDFSEPQYQSTEELQLDEHVHLHDGRGDMIHIHRKNITLGYFVDTLGFSLTDQCLTLDTGQELCGALKVFVNGEQIQNAPEYEIQDEDMILISYGEESESAVQTQIDSVTDEACIYSLTCPERGEPPHSECIGTECG